MACFWFATMVLRFATLDLRGFIWTLSGANLEDFTVGLHVSICRAYDYEINRAATRCRMERIQPWAMVLGSA